MTTENIQAAGPQRRGVSLGTVILVSAITSVLAVWLASAWLFPKSFSPVALSTSEQTALQTKVESLHLDLKGAPAEAKRHAPDRVLEPQKYSEAGASRQIAFTEREINALIANNTDLASRVAVDLSPGLVSAQALIPLDPQMPLFGGKTLRISAGLSLGYSNGKPIVILRGVSVWGVPVPNAWLGDLKNVDLVHEFGNEGFWKNFAAGVDNIAVGDGVLSVKLKE